MGSFFNETVQRLHGVSPEWHWCAIDASGSPGGYIKITGCVPIGRVTRGPRQGRLKWPPKKDMQSFWVHRSDLEESSLMYERDTGNCRVCSGSGQEWCGWHHIEGNKYRPCSRCKATGKAPSASVANPEVPQC